MKNRNNIFIILILILSVFTSCTDSEDSGLDGIFRPKIVSGYPIVNGNTIKLLWYNIADAESYTVEMYTDELYKNKVSDETVSDLAYTSPKLPYSTRIYIRLKANSKRNGYTSIWRELNVSTADRDVKPLLKGIKDDNITDDGVTIFWDVDDAYPADSITVQGTDTLDNGEYPDPVQIKLSTEEFHKGTYKITGLKECTNYVVTLYNSAIEDKYERPYNSAKFKTAGPPDGAIVLLASDDLLNKLSVDQNDPSIKDGQVYYLKDGGTYNLDGFAFTKGFSIVGAVGKTSVLNIKSSFTPVDNCGRISFSNVNLVGENRIIDNEVNDGKSYTFAGIRLSKCTLTDFPGGVIRLQSSDGNKKEISNIEIDNCIFRDIQQGRLIETDNYSDKSQVLAHFGKIKLTNSTFIDSPQFALFFVPDAYGYSGSTVDITIQCITAFESLANNGRMIQMNRLGSDSKITISNCLFSIEDSNNTRSDSYVFYETCLCGSATKQYADNYFTGPRAEAQKTNIGLINLNMSQEALFVNPAERDLTIKDESSKVFIYGIGDPRWLER